jgi:hypothetical protein
MEIPNEEGCRRQKVRTLSQAVESGADHERREMQLFLVGYMIVSICEIFTVGGFPLDSKVRIVRSLHALSWQ